MTTLTDYDDSTLGYEYDAPGDVESMPDYRNSERACSYNDAGRLSSMTAPGTHPPSRGARATPFKGGQPPSSRAGARRLVRFFPPSKGGRGDVRARLTIGTCTYDDGDNMTAKSEPYDDDFNDENYTGWSMSAGAWSASGGKQGHP